MRVDRPAKAAEAPMSPAQGSLYANRVKVYPARVHGRFRRFKWAFLVFALAVYYLLPWLRWHRPGDAPDQFLLIDLVGRRFYLGPLEVWPQEIYLVTFLLIFSAIALFLVTSLFGRVWCGFACPQTVWTDLYMWVERRIEGDRNARMRLDQGPRNGAYWTKKVTKHAIWLVIAAATGGSFVLYVQDAPTAVRAIFTGQAGAWTYTFVGILTFTTYALAGWAREQVCTYMCPWPRFQAAMLDTQSLVVTYRAWRGEPRGKHKQGESWDGRGDCVDCRQCVHVCPTGIDIRDGQQLECIGCGLCIDACDAIMDKVGRPRGLIALDTLADMQACERAVAGVPPGPRRVEIAAAAHTPLKLIRPRTLIYAAVLGLVGLLMLGTLAMRETTELAVLRDRAPLFVTLADGSVRNSYTLKIVEKRHHDRTLTLHLDGLPGATLAGLGVDEARDRTIPLSVRPGSVATHRVHVFAPAGAPLPASMPVIFRLVEPDGREAARHASVFLAPGR
ncbi:cytochrome c oxidase accessory protein CcoG [Elioraea sp.]|jgi:cytochrome c oxidase accessory protein FixG|uniref:cytochrome c oxidase accessory protein CcoG n=1 Tax=Elioraea sp. TaxID=2185103 RepID=UPI0021DEBE78|nr:cytochrome c oxidase accessory protein CcoG [Elioraea sp.]GIX09269.1 MAG: ferredoxin [Elioraea sp.]